MHVLIADASQQLAAALARCLRRDGMTVDIASDGTMALALSKTTHYDVIVFDQDLPPIHTDVLCQQFRDHEHHATILMLNSTSATLDTAQARGEADARLAKPFDLDHFTALVRSFARS